MKSIQTKWKKAAYAVFAAVFWIGVWQIVHLVYDMDFVLPGPAKTLSVLVEKITTASFWSAIAFSVLRILLGFSLACLLAVVLSVLSIKIKVIKILFDPFCAVVRAVPVASFIILVLVMFSSSNVSVVIAFLMGFPVVYSNLRKATDTTPAELLEVADVFSISFFGRLKYIYLPHALPFAASGFSVACGLCFKSGIAAEVIGYPKGSVGEAMYLSKIGFDMPGLLSYTAVIVVISVICEKLILFLCKRKTKGARG